MTAALPCSLGAPVVPRRRMDGSAADPLHCSPGAAARSLFRCSAGTFTGIRLSFRRWCGLQFCDLLCFEAGLHDCAPRVLDFVDERLDRGLRPERHIHRPCFRRFGDRTEPETLAGAAAVELAGGPPASADADTAQALLILDSLADLAYFCCTERRFLRRYPSLQHCHLMC